MDNKNTRVGRLSRRRHRNCLKVILKLLIGIILTILLFNFFNWYRDYKYQKLTKYEIRGVTVSQQNSYVDFISLANIGEKFVYIRASQGSIYTDDDFADNYQRSQGSTLKVGVYHSFSFQSSAQKQFANFSTEVNNDIGILPIAVQINTSDVDLSPENIQSVRSFIKRIYSHYDRRVIIWASKRVYDQINFKLDQNECLFWALSNNLGNQTSGLKTYSSNQTLKNDGQNQQFIQSVFVGTNQQWEAYSQPNLKQHGGKFSE